MSKVKYGVLQFVLRGKHRLRAKEQQTSAIQEHDDSVMLRRRGSRPGPYEEGKRSTINLGVEDLPAASNPESFSRFYTDDEALTSPARRPSSSNDLDSFSPFLMREYLRVEDAEMRQQLVSCVEEKENKLRERRKSLIVAEDVAPPQGRTGHGPCRPLENLLSMKDASASKEDSVFLCGSEKGGEMDVQSPAKQEASMFTTPQSLAADAALTSQTPPVPPPRKKRDARRRIGVYRMDSSGSSTPCTPTSPGTSGFPGTHVVPGNHDTAGTFFLGSPATPGSPSSASLDSLSPSGDNCFFGRKGMYEYTSSSQDNRDTTATPDTLRTLNSTPETPGSPSSPDSPGRFFTKSLHLEDGAMPEFAQKSHTLDNRRHRRRGKNDTWDGHLGQSTEDLPQIGTPKELRRSMSEYHTSDTGGSGNKARCASESSKKDKGKAPASIRDRLFRQSKKDNSAKGLSSRAFNRWSKKGSSRQRKESSEDHTDGEAEGVVAGVTHGSQGSAPPSPKLPASSSAESTPKRNFLHQLHRFKKGAKNASKATATKGKTRGAESLEGGVDGLARAHSQENLHHSPLSHASSPLQSRPRIQDQDEKRRTENTLKIWIMEAKDIASKKKYFCHLIVDSQPSHRTCSKTMTNMCFWGEYFELDLNPETTTICIELKREGDKKSPKRIGSVEIDLKPSSPGRATLEEQWYAVKVDRPDKTCPALRIKHRFQSLDILPLSQYGPLRMYLKDNSTSLCQLLEPVVSVKAKEDIATTLINIMQVEDCAITFLVDLVYTDIQSNAENEHLLFRGNSVATKAIEAYMKLVGEQYLHDTLQEPIQALITSGEDLEVDHFKITNLQSLQEQRKSLKEQVTAVWEKILQSSRNFPVELRKVFHKLREKLSRQEKCELTDNLISSCVFLRFFCPAVLAPSLFNITTEYPDERANRNLTLVAKTLQTLANFTHFQGKESFMEFLNDFINKEQERCRTFLKAISSVPSPEDSHLEFDGKIDLGKHLALLHLHLADVLTEINTQGYESEASRVNALVDDISALLGGNHNEVSYARRPSSGPPLNASPALAPPHLHYNNNYTREECLDSVGEAGTGLVLPHATNRSQSFPRATTPVYANHHMVPGNQRQPFRHPERSAVNDLTNSEEFVLITAFDHSSRPQISMSLSEEANNNNTPAMDVRVTNSNTFYMSEASPAPIHHLNYQPQRALLHSTVQPRPHHRPGISRNLSVGGVPSPAERRRFEGHCSDLFRYMDDVTHKMSAICKDGENNIQGSQTSISQLSNIASSGYQSFAYSQSSSPVDSLLHTDNSSLLSRENGNPGLPVGIRQIHDSPLDPASERTSEEPPTATMTPRMT